MGWQLAASRWAGGSPRKWLPAPSLSLRVWFFSAIRCILRGDPTVFAQSICRTSRRRCCSFKVRATPSELPTNCARSLRRSTPPPMSTSSKEATTRSRFGKKSASGRTISTARSRIISQPGCGRGSPSGQCHERGRDGAAQQGFARLPLSGGIEVREELHLATCEERHRQATAVEQAVAGQCGELWPGGQDAGEIERVGTGK